MEIIVYTFETANPDTGEFESETEWHTQDYLEAKDYAELHQCRLIGNTYEWSDSELVEDYTPEDDGDNEDEEEE